MKYSLGLICKKLINSSVIFHRKRQSNLPPNATMGRYVYLLDDYFMSLSKHCSLAHKMKNFPGIRLTPQGIGHKFPFAVRKQLLVSARTWWDEFLSHWRTCWWPNIWDICRNLEDLVVYSDTLIYLKATNSNVPCCREIFLIIYKKKKKIQAHLLKDKCIWRAHRGPLMCTP